MLLSISLVAIASFLFQGHIASGDIIDTGYAKYLGNRTLPNTVAYLGVPYAEPPLGERRFRAPLPLNTTRIAQTANGAAIDARSYPDFCIQGTIGLEGDAGGAGSENCLKVNIYTPVGARRGSNLPVLVYIHGGGYIFGNPRNWPFDHWVQQSPNVVIVSVYYRLSSFGFMSVPEFSDSTIGDFNAGFQDQIQALRWVKEHIASFGGNPNKVTINGESAGGSSVELHLVANTGEKLFTGAIAQSVFRTPLPTPEEQQPLFQFYAEQAGCGTGSTVTQLSCLRRASVSALARAQDGAMPPAFTGPYRTFHPVIDGKLFTNYPTQSVNAGKFAQVPLMVGATTNETLTGGADLPSAWRNYCPSITTADIDALLALYPSSAFSTAALQMETASGDLSVRCGRTILAAAFSKHTNAWTYRYNQRNPTGGGAGVGHAAENWMMFLGSNTGVNGSATFTPLKPVEASFASELIAYWLSFVRAGNPNTFKLPRSPIWPSYSVTNRNRIVLQQDLAGTTTHSGSILEREVDPETQRCTVIGSQPSQEN
ncbi:Alpha/Beta hydrolase protein [Collybia nuda]|uniref:Carboxylic ester hydrolase n=1 Tax=Collybia nuda TaxID=64659 RepID=A0A9P6CFL3_9AGAR|nr:Alpha/Beta hydrolase protein [Collybia nuda]